VAMLKREGTSGIASGLLDHSAVVEQARSIAVPSSQLQIAAPVVAVARRQVVVARWGTGRRASGGTARAHCALCQPELAQNHRSLVRDLQAALEDWDRCLGVAGQPQLRPRSYSA
jgi:hypothetical protein